MGRNKLIKFCAMIFPMVLVLTACGSDAGETTTDSQTESEISSNSETTNETGTETASVPETDYLSTYNVASEGEVTLNVMITSLGDSDGGPFLRQVMDDYMAMYPNVTLTPVECSMNELYTTLVTQSTAGTLPDIFTMSEAYSANSVEMGMGISNLDEMLGEEYMSGLLDVAVDNSTVDGTFVYLPWQNNTTAMVYRKDLFEEKGLEVPTSWDDFLIVAKELTEDLDGNGKTDRFGAVFAGTRNDSAESRFQTFALTFGCDFVIANDDGTFKSGFGTDAFSNAMRTFVDLAANEGICPEGLVETGYSEAYTLIAADEACMFFSGSNVLGGIYNANPDMKGKMGSFPMPTADGIDPVTSFSSVGMTVSSSSEHPEVAVDFLKYMTSVENSLEWNQATCRLPVVKDAVDAIVASDEAYSGFAKASEDAVIYPAFAGLAELRDTVGECWQNIVSVGMSEDEAITNAVTKSEEIVSSYSN